jgi:NAD(P)H-hydrate epimerase
MVTFTTEDGRELPAVSAEEMRQIDRVAVEDVGLSLLQMMENAGRALASVVSETRPADAGGPVVVLAGGGGNGGGGLCAARHLNNYGIAVDAVLDRDPDTFEGAVAAQRRILRATDVGVDDETSDLGDPSVVVDALVGYGLRGPPAGRAETLV